MKSLLPSSAHQRNVWLCGKYGLFFSEILERLWQSQPSLRGYVLCSGRLLEEFSA